MQAIRRALPRFGHDLWPVIPCHSVSENTGDIAHAHPHENRMRDSFLRLRLFKNRDWPSARSAPIAGGSAYGLHVARERDRVMKFFLICAERHRLDFGFLTHLLRRLWKKGLQENGLIGKETFDVWILLRC